jgi:flagellar biogenesis protein FliO
MYLRSLAALAAVLALLLAARWLLARQGLAAITPLRRADGLHVTETLSLDARNRLVVARRGEAELLLAVGPQGIQLLDVREAPSSATARIP